MVCNSLEEVRANIDRIDDEIIKLIAERVAYVGQVSSFEKNEEGVRDTGRVEKVIAYFSPPAQINLHYNIKTAQGI